MRAATLVEGANVINGPKYNKGPINVTTLCQKSNNHFQIEINIDLMTCDWD